MGGTAQTRVAAYFEFNGASAKVVDVASAIRAESALADPEWEELLHLLSKLSVDDKENASRLEASVIDFSRRHLLKGTPIDHVHHFGRLIEQEVAIAYLENMGFTYEIAKETLWSYVYANRYPMSQHLPDFPLGRYIIWSTYCTDPDPDRSPFYPCVEPINLPIELGLRPVDLTKQAYFVFQYSLPSSTTPRRPTIADAYAGGFGPFRFRPLGRTHPGTMLTGDEVGRPECVHEVVTAKSLTRAPGAIPHPGLPR